MRLLCRIVNRKGLAYVFAAPTERYLAEQPRMLHITQSIVFMAPKSAKPGGNSGGNNGKTLTAAQTKAIERSLRFVTWTEPTEQERGDTSGPRRTAPISSPPAARSRAAA